MECFMNASWLLAGQALSGGVLIGLASWLLLVGVGTVLGSGCTSGHGVCGMGRKSVRSLVATLVFMGFDFATVFVISGVAGRAMI
jgi:uncharacterized membrane protein YedE/YeeE